VAALLTLGELVAARPQRQLYRAQRGTEPWAIVVLPEAEGSAAGWVERLRALCERGAGLQGSNLVLFTEMGSLSGHVAVGRRWVDGTSAWALGRGKTDGLPPLLALLALVDLAVALEQLHAASLFHGGIGPEAAIVDPEGHLLLVDAGLGPVLSGKPGSEAADIRALGKLAYFWLTSREAELDPREPVPADFGLPSRLDRRVPAQVDPLIVRTLQAGGPRGLRQAKELVAGLRQVLRSAGAAVSPADLAQWVAKSSQAARVKPTLAPLLQPGPAQWEPLSEKRAPQKLVMGPAAPKAARAAATLVDMPRVVLAAAEEPEETSRTDTSQSTQRSQSTAAMPALPGPLGKVGPRQLRRWIGIAGTAALVVGALVLWQVSKSPGPTAGGPAFALPALPSLPSLAAPPAASGPATAAPALPRELPEYQLPVYDPNAPQKPKAGAPKAERPASRLGRGAWLSVEANRVARVFVDGHDLQLLTPVQKLPIAPGNHKVRLVAAMGGDSSQEFEVNVERGKTAYRFGNLDE
jgi:hypothetical protein